MSREYTPSQETLQGTALQGTALQGTALQETPSAGHPVRYSTATGEEAYYGFNESTKTEREHDD